MADDRHGDEILSLVIEGMIERTRSRGRRRTKDISQIMQDTGLNYWELKDWANDGERWRRHFL